MKRQGGFTLIELVVVIVILGILAVTAAPKFLNLQNDARSSSLQGLKGAIDGAAAITYGKAAIEGKEGKAAAADNKVDEILIGYGYPTAATGGIVKVVTGLDTDWTGIADTTTTPKSYVATFKDSTLTTPAKVIATECYVKYQEATSAAVATTSVVVTGEACK